MKARDIIMIQEKTPLPFTQKVLEVVKNIPHGTTMTYGQVASLAGSSRAARVVGSIMAQNKDLDVPCHRVIRSDGALGNYNGLRGISKKDILEKEKAI